MPKPQLLVYKTTEELAYAAANRFIDFSQRAIARKGRFLIVLAGGTTPQKMYSTLASSEFAKQVDWAKVYVFWGDERLVPPGDPESNYRAVHSTLLIKVPIPRENVFAVETNL